MGSSSGRLSIIYVSICAWSGRCSTRARWTSRAATTALVRKSHLRWTCRVMASALGPKAFELCGAEADGAISWVCPPVYLRDVAVPAINSGAERAGRAAPPLAAHVPVCVLEDAQEVRAAVRQQFGFFAQAPFYQRVFIAAGFPETSEGSWSDAMIDAVAISGSESQVKHKLDELSSFGAAEILASPVAAGADRAGSLDRTLRLLAEVASGAGV